MKISFKLMEGAVLPTYATRGSAAFDIYSNQDAVIQYGQPAIIQTGLIPEIEEDHALLLFSRSGHGFNYNTRLANAVGVIDSDYRGQILVKLTMDFPSWQVTYNVAKGDRIAQGIVIPVPRVYISEVFTVSETARGEGGFGSTGTS
jgi:dUTP pyrophosphatase